MRLSDIIEQYIRELISNEPQIVIQRNELAEFFNCVPSQINYVITTRFNPERGFYVESRRGGGGSIKITKINRDKAEYIQSIILNIGSSISQQMADNYIKDLLEYNLINEDQARLIKVAVSDNILGILDNSTRDKLRASLLKNMVINI